MALPVSSFALLLRTLTRAGPCCRLLPTLESRFTRCLGTWHQHKTIVDNSTASSWLCRLSASSDRRHGLVRGGASLPQSHIPTPSPILVHVNTMKKKTAIKRRCKDCKIVIKDKRAYVICKTSPRHNQVQG